MELAKKKAKIHETEQRIAQMKKQLVQSRADTSAVQPKANVTESKVQTAQERKDNLTAAAAKTANET